MLIEDETKLKAWISQVVEDISDAEPDALAKYVIALLKKPLSDADLEKLCSDKLSVFLQSHTESFVSRLFETLKNGRYLPIKDALAAAEPPKLTFEQTKPKMEQKSAAEHDELVLTDGESDHDLEREELPRQKHTKASKEKSQQHQLHAKAVSVLSSPSSTYTKQQLHHSSSPRRNAAIVEPRPKVRVASPSSTVAGSAAQPSLTPAKPPRKRISPPPRSSSAERRAGGSRRASPLPSLRRRVVLTGGSSGGSMRISSSNRLTVVERERHHRGGVGGGGNGRGTVVGRSHSKSRSPHRKDKRLVGVELEPRITSPRRHRCRDFHEKGFCMRGDNCPFDHGPDPVVVENSALKDIVRDTTIFDSSTSTYGVNPPPPGLESTVTPSSICVNKLTGVVSEGYNPEAPSMDTTSAAVSRIDFSVPPPPLPQHFLQQQRQLLYPPAPTVTGILPTFAAANVTTAPTDSASGGIASLRPAVDSSLGVNALRGPLPSTIDVSVSDSMPTYGGGTVVVSSIRPLAPLNGASLVSSTFQQDTRMAMRSGRFKPYTMGVRNPTSRSLLVRKIPPELNKIAQIDQHFSRFGQVTNIQVQYEGRTDSALVTFKSRREAMSAYKSTEPIFNNRFVKVFWQNDANNNAIENEDTGVGAGENASSGPTIPLVDSNVANQKIMKEPIQFPRYFTKVFAQQKKESGDGSGSAEESLTVAISPEDNKTLSTHVDTTDLAPPVIETAAPQQPRPIYNPKLAALKKRATVERDRLNKLAEVQRMKTELYTKLVEQQKNLLKKLQQTEDKEAKKKIVKYLKAFEIKVKGVKTELEQLALKVREMQIRQPPVKRTRTGYSMSEQQSLEEGVEAGSLSEKDGGKIGQHQSPSKYSMPNKKLLKLCRIVYVSLCPPEFNEKLILHMERFGELFDYDINAIPQIFTYKEPLDAQRAVNEAAGSFEHAKLIVQWAPVAKGVKNDIVPDGERKPSEQVAAKDLLASLEYDEEEDDEKKEEEEEQFSDKAETNDLARPIKDLDPLN